MLVVANLVALAVVLVVGVVGVVAVMVSNTTYTMPRLRGGRLQRPAGGTRRGAFRVLL